MKKSRIGREDVSGFVFDVFSGELHAKRIESLSDVTLGVIKSGSLAIRTIGAGLAIARELEWKHAVKQADRCIGNEEIDPWELAEKWVPFVTAGHSEIFVALDWTEFDSDKQSTLMAGLLTGHGRTTPLLWKTWLQTDLKGHRNEYEDEMLPPFNRLLKNSISSSTVATRSDLSAQCEEPKQDKRRCCVSFRPMSECLGITHCVKSKEWLMQVCENCRECSMRCIARSAGHRFLLSGSSRQVY